MNNPLLSIVIANYNYGRFLEEAIQSVLSQTCDDYELIIVDGGSTDNSVEIIKKYEDKIAWWVSEKDKGQSDAFNKGFTHARGKFGCWLNADDILMPNAIRAVVEYIKKHPKAEWVCGSSVFADEQFRVKWCSRCVRVLNLFQKHIPWYSINGPSSFFLLENLNKVGGFDLDLHYTMDTDLWRRFIKSDIKLHYVKDYIWCFRVHEESKTSHKFVTGRGSNSFATEGQAMNLRYGITSFKNRLASYLNRLARLIFGTYLHSYLDTRRYKGRKICEIGE
jgi:glycosyltransferase involved in cell wall biosynthesis